MKFIQKGNWGLRLLALALAIVLYYALKNETAQSTTHHDRSFFKAR